jgi:hypothetical protein
VLFDTGGPLLFSSKRRSADSRWATLEDRTAIKSGRRLAEMSLHYERSGCANYQTQSIDSRVPGDTSPAGRSLTYSSVGEQVIDLYAFYVPASYCGWAINGATAHFTTNTLTCEPQWSVDGGNHLARAAPPTSPNKVQIYFGPLVHVGSRIPVLTLTPVICASLGRFYLAPR